MVQNTKIFVPYVQQQKSVDVATDLYGAMHL